MKDVGAIRDIAVHDCVDGKLFEFVRNEAFGQLTARWVNAGETAGGHKHPITREWWLVLVGTATVFLEYPDGIREMRTVSGDKPEIIDLPPGTGHDIKAHEGGDVLFIFWADRLYDAKSHDKIDWEW